MQTRWAHWRAPIALFWLLRVAWQMRRDRQQWLSRTGSVPLGNLRSRLDEKELAAWESRLRTLQAVARRIRGFACLVRASALANWMRHHGLAAEVVIAVWRKSETRTALGHAFVRVGERVFDEVGINHTDLQEVAFGGSQDRDKQVGA